MTFSRTLRFNCIALSASLLAGCLAGKKELNYIGDKAVQYYKDASMSVDYPHFDEQEPSDSALMTAEPRRLRSQRKDEVWPMTLQEALHLAVKNNEIIRSSAQFLNPGNQILSGNEFGVTSVYNPAIQETGVQFGGRGIEAALADFDATFSTSTLWGRTEQVQDSASVGFSELSPSVTEFADFRSRLEKAFADSTQFSITHNWLYTGQNQSGPNARPFPSQYEGRPGTDQNPGLPTLGFELRRPLWAGAGAEYTRIAAPFNGRRQTLQGVAAVDQGVVIARIRNDVEITDFEISVANLLKDVEETYWSLYLAYRTYDTEVQARTSALQTWREVKAKFDLGAEHGGAADEAQARDNYFEIKARAGASLSSLYQTEAQFRRLLGLPVNDGKIIRPSDEPITSEFQPEWQASLVEALTVRPELRRQKWNIKSLELQMKAAKSLTHPRLDVVSRYQVNAFGDDLLGRDNERLNAQDTRGPFQSAYGRLLDGNETGWGLGIEFEMPLGFRSANAQVRNLELRLARGRATLSAQETEISHELGNAFQVLDESFVGAQINFNRRRAAERRVQAFEAEYRAGRTTLDLLLRAQISLAQAENEYYRTLVSYNRAIYNVSFRKGTLLQDNNVHLAEGAWTPKAYEQALRRAWARSHALKEAHLRTEPSEFVTSVPPTQTITWDGAADGAPADELPKLEIPPQPVPPSEDSVPIPVDPPAPRPAPIPGKLDKSTAGLRPNPIEVANPNSNTTRNAKDATARWRASDSEPNGQPPRVAEELDHANRQPRKVSPPADEFDQFLEENGMIAR